MEFGLESFVRVSRVCFMIYEGLVCVRKGEADWRMKALVCSTEDGSLQSIPVF
jgi:hypothetical protein